MEKSWGLNGDKQFLYTAATRAKNRLDVLVIGHVNIHRLKDLIINQSQGAG